VLPFRNGGCSDFDPVVSATAFALWSSPGRGTDLKKNSSGGAKSNNARPSNPVTDAVIVTLEVALPHGTRELGDLPLPNLLKSNDFPKHYMIHQSLFSGLALKSIGNDFSLHLWVVTPLGASAA